MDAKCIGGVKESGVLFRRCISVQRANLAAAREDLRSARLVSCSHCNSSVAHVASM